MTKLKDVAALAGVSPATASLALNGRSVNAKTRQLVVTAAKQLNYVPNKIGQSLTNGRSNTLELVILNVADHPNIVRKTALFYYLMEGVLAVADEQGFGVRFAVRSHDDPDLTAYFADLVGAGTVDGAIVVPQFARDYRFTHILHDTTYPCVFLLPDRFGKDVSHVDMGNEAGGSQVANLFIDVGAERIAMINGPVSHVDAIERERGFTGTILDRGAMIVALQHGDFTIESGHAAMGAIIERALPDAVFCANDYMAAGALKFLRERKIRVPGDVAVVGYDNNDLAIATDPPLTTVDNHFFDLGKALAEDVIAQVTCADGPTTRTIVPTLVTRSSHLLGRAADD